jgi:hypothetical protein
MTHKASNYVAAFLLGATTLPALACDLPKLPVIPAKDQIGDRAPAVNAATAAYFDGMRVYAGCIQDQLAAAGGDTAPASVKAAYVARSEAAVAEAQAIQQLYQERVAVAAASGKPGTEAALRKLVEGLASGTPDYDSMTAGMQRATRQQLGDLRRDTAALGPITSLEFTGADPRGLDIYQIRGENGSLEGRIGLDEEGKISAAWLRPPGAARVAPRRSPKDY